jgi:hypothetical protein
MAALLPAPVPPSWARAATSSSCQVNAEQTETVLFGDGARPGQRKGSVSS